MVHSVWGWGSVGGPAHIHGVCRASRLRGQLAVGVMARRVGVPERISVLGSLQCRQTGSGAKVPAEQSRTEPELSLRGT